MRLKNVPGSREAIAESRFVIQNPQEHAGKWNEVFGRTAPLHIEIGMGKGRFLMEMAAIHPDINYIGIEKYSSVLIRAIQKMEENELANVRFIRMDAEEQEAVDIMHKAINGMRTDDAVESILNMFARTRNNREFIGMVKKTRIV